MKAELERAEGSLERAAQSLLRLQVRPWNMYMFVTDRNCDKCETYKTAYSFSPPIFSSFLLRSKGPCDTGLSISAARARPTAPIAGLSSIC